MFKQTNKQTNKLAKAIFCAAVGLGSISTANATMVRDDYTATASGFTSGQVNFSVTYDNANFTTTNFSNGYSNDFLNPIFDLGSFTSLFPSINYSNYKFMSFTDNGRLYEGLRLEVSGSGGHFGASEYDNSRYLNMDTMSFIPLSQLSRTQTDLTAVPPTNNAVPEPESIALMGLGFLGMAASRRKKAV
jgi:hypothetical protein